ncbi:hypothetical protein V8C86DRAFT_3124692 [Haematococcus lacustris]
MPHWTLVRRTAASRVSRSCARGTSSVRPSSVEVKVERFSHRQPLLALRLVRTLPDANFPGAAWANVHEVLCRKYCNSCMQVDEHANYQRLFALSGGSAGGGQGIRPWPDPDPDPDPDGIAVEGQGGQAWKAVHQVLSKVGAEVLRLRRDKGRAMEAA